MRDERAADHGVLVDSDAIRTWSAERDLIPVYYEEENRYELVYEGEVMEGDDRHGWDEFSRRFDDRDERLVYDETDEGVSSARFVGQTRAPEGASERDRIDPNADVAGTGDPHADGTATTDRDGSETGTDTATEDSGVDPSDRGKRVFDRDGNEIGTDEQSGELYVDPDPSVLDEIKTRLGWGSEDGDDCVITHDRVVSREGHQIVVHWA